MIIVDGYIRVSTEEQAQDGYGMDAQLAKLRGYESLFGNRDRYQFRIGDIISDAGISAKTLDRRPGLQAALGRLDRGESQGLIVAKLDRLTRHLGDWQKLVDRYFSDDAGKRLIAVDNEVNTLTANGRAMLNMIILFAQWERETIGERTRDGLQAKKAKGERVGALIYGHDLAADGVRLTPNAAEQAAIETIRTLRAEGRSLGQIADELAGRGIKTKAGRDRWDRKTILRILKRGA